MYTHSWASSALKPPSEEVNGLVQGAAEPKQGLQRGLLNSVNGRPLRLEKVKYENIRSSPYPFLQVLLVFMPKENLIKKA